MSYKCNEVIEKLDFFINGIDINKLTNKQRRELKYHTHSRKSYKKIHRKWLRNQYKKNIDTNLENCYHGYEY